MQLNFQLCFSTVSDLWRNLHSLGAQLAVICGRGGCAQHQGHSVYCQITVKRPSPVQKVASPINNHSHCVSFVVVVVAVDVSIWRSYCMFMYLQGAV